MPGSLISAAFRAAALGLLSLPRAVALVSLHPARLAGLADRGAIAPGLAADLVRLRVHDGIPVARRDLAGGRAGRVRVALYWAPAADDPLWHAGNSWLGRDPETGASPACPRPARHRGT